MGAFDFLKKKNSTKDNVASGSDNMPTMPELPEIPSETNTDNSSLPPLPESKESQSATPSLPELPDSPQDNSSLPPLPEPKEPQSTNLDLPEVPNNYSTPEPTENEDDFALPSFDEMEGKVTPEENAEEDSFDFSLEDTPNEEDNSLDLALPTEENSEPEIEFPLEDTEQQSFPEPPSFESDDDEPVDAKEIPDGPHYLNLNAFENILDSINKTKSDAETGIDLAEDLYNTDSKVGKAYGDLQTALIALNKNLKQIDNKLFK